MIKDKKGFTLVEVLSVIGIIGILLLITIPTIDSILLKQRKKLYNEHLIEVKDALKLWGDVNADRLPTEVYAQTSVTLKELKTSGYIKDEYINPITDKCYSNDNSFEILYTNGVYTYKVEKLIDGNEEDCIIGYRGVDTSSPVVRIEVIGAKKETGWYTSVPYVVVEASDSESGIDRLNWCMGINCIPSSGNVETTITEKEDGRKVIELKRAILDTKEMQVCVEAIDKANRTSGEVCSEILKVDTILPKIDGVVSDITLALNQEIDLRTGVSVKEEGSGLEGGLVINPESIDTSKAGVTKVTYKAADKAGNSKIEETLVTVSASAPTITFEAEEGTINENGWAKEKFYVKVNVKDNSGHGIKEFNVCTSTTGTCNPNEGIKIEGKTTTERLIEVESANNRICVIAKDNYNPENDEVVCSSAYKLDMSKPTAGTIKVNGSSTIKEWYTENVTITPVDGEDSLSGHLSTIVDKGSLSESGSIKVTTKDKAGNENTRSYSIKIDKSTPACSFSALNYIGKNKTATISLTCTNSKSGMSDKTLSVSDFTVNNSNISLTGITKEKVTNGYKYTLTLKGLTEGSTIVTLPANKVQTVAGLGNAASQSSTITVTSISLNPTSGSTRIGGDNLTSTITSSNAGTITCSSNNTSVATCSVSGSTLTVVPGSTEGTATITLTGNNGSPTATYTVTVEIGYKCSSGTLVYDQNKGSSSGGYICVKDASYTTSQECVEYGLINYMPAYTYESCGDHSGMTNNTYYYYVTCYQGSPTVGCSNNYICTHYVVNPEYSECKQYAYSYNYYCPSGWSNYSGSNSSGSNSSTKCYTNASK